VKRHPLDLLSLLPGLAFVGLAVLTLAGGLTVDLLASDWFWPSVLVVLGLVVLVPTGRNRRSQPERTVEVGPDDPSVGDGSTVGM
jgi:hypothetical protein